MWNLVNALHTVGIQIACLWTKPLSLTDLLEENTTILPLGVYETGYIGFSAATGNYIIWQLYYIRLGP